MAIQLNTAKSIKQKAPNLKKLGAFNWGDRWGSNPRQPESQSGALPTELRPPLN